MSQTTNPLQLRFILNPLYWITWLGIGLLYLTSQLPYAWMLRIGTALGWLGFYLLPSRRRITRTNLRLVFPEHNKHQINKLTKESFYSAGIALLESAWAWWASDEKIRPLLQVAGLEHLREAEKLNKGVLLLGGHYTTLEISGRLLAYYSDKVYPTYKPARNKLFEAVMAQNRRKMNKGLVNSRNMRNIIKLLKQQQIVWYAPDQDFGRHVSVFAPFMGIPAATLTMTIRLARAAKAPVVPYYSERLPDNKGYRISFGPMLEGFPSGDDVRDATSINAAIEKQVYKTPGQYLWGHRRFKSRPHGEAQVYRPRRGRFLHRYTLTLSILGLPTIIYTAWIAIRNRQLRYFLERLTSVNCNKADIVIHAASIGEVNAIAPLVKKIGTLVPDIKILFTMNTPSGRHTAEKHFGDSVSFRYMPVDWHWLSYVCLKKINPRCSIITETEIWPNYYEYFYYKGIPNIIVNARLSERATRAPYIVRTWLTHACQFVTAVLARSDEDAERYLSFDAHEDHVKVIGNIKYAAKPDTSVDLPDLGRDFVLLASSRNGEEKQIVKTWISITDHKPLLVIVPRHIHRLNEILGDIKGMVDHVAVRSRGDRIDESTQIYIADTFGELTGFIKLAQFVMMGGSFEPYGGQNIIEVAQAGKALLFGCHMDNFKMEAEQFLQADAAIQVESYSVLKDELERLLADPGIAKRLGENGQSLVKQHEHVIDEYYNGLKRYCSCIK